MLLPQRLQRSLVLLPARLQRRMARLQLLHRLLHLLLAVAQRSNLALRLPPLADLRRELRLLLLH